MYFAFAEGGYFGVQSSGVQNTGSARPLTIMIMAEGIKYSGTGCPSCIALRSYWFWASTILNNLHEGIITDCGPKKGNSGYKLPRHATFQQGGPYFTMLVVTRYSPHHRFRF